RRPLYHWRPCSFRRRALASRSDEPPRLRHWPRSRARCAARCRRATGWEDAARPCSGRGVSAPSVLPKPSGRGCVNSATWRGGRTLLGEKCRHRHFDSIAGGDVVDDAFVPVQSLGPSANVRGNFIAPKFQCAETRTEWIMNRLRTFAIIVSAVSCVLSACATTQSNFSSEDTLTPGIFLEPEPRTALPPGVELRNPGVELRKPGVELRKVYNQGLQLTKSFEGFRGRLYHDAAGYCTIAYGHVVKLAPCDGSEPDEFLNGVSEPRGGELLVKDLE